MKTHHFILIVALVLSHSSCDKHVKRSKLWVDLTVRSAVTGNPVKSRIVLEYTDVSMLGSWKEEIDLGETDNNGYIEIRQTLGRKVPPVHLKIYGIGGQYSNIWADGLAQTIEASLGKKNKITAYLQPTYHYLLSATNVNCFDETDSLWISTPVYGTSMTFSASGCANTVFHWAGNPTHNFSFWTDQDSVTFDVTVKRNGVVNSFQETFNLQENITVPLHINY